MEDKFDINNALKSKSIFTLQSWDNQNLESREKGDITLDIIKHFFETNLTYKQNNYQFIDYLAININIENYSQSFLTLNNDYNVIIHWDKMTSIDYDEMIKDVKRIFEEEDSETLIAFFVEYITKLNKPVSVNKSCNCNSKCGTKSKKR